MITRVRAWDRLLALVAGMGVAYCVAGWETGEEALKEYSENMAIFEAQQESWNALAQEVRNDERNQPPEMPLLKQHIQGYIVFRKPESRTKLQDLLGCKAHVENAKGSHEQNKAYCTKEATGVDVIEFGTMPRTGQRSDLDAIRMELQGPGSRAARLMNITTGYFSTWVRNYRALGAYVDMYDQSKMENREGPPQIFTYWGDAGTGKTRRVYEESPNVFNVPVSSNDSLWFDGYNGHDDVLFDDFYGGIKFGKMLKLLDRYPIQVPVKGGYVKWQPKRIYMTSNTNPKDWYPGVPAESRRGLRRRMTENGSRILRFVKPMMLVDPDERKEG